MVSHPLYCMQCFQPTPSEELQLLNRQFLCSKCRRAYRQCCQCKGHFLKLVRVGKDELCENCFRNQDILLHPRKRIYPFHACHADELGDSNKLYLGVELEVDAGDKEVHFGLKDIAELQKEVVRHGSVSGVFIKWDYSLVNGFELVTDPFTYRYHREEFPWPHLFKRLKAMGLEARENCGLHVHIAKWQFGRTMHEEVKNVLKFAFLVEKFWSKLWAFSRRSKKAMRWCRPYRIPLPFDYFFETFGREMGKRHQNRDNLKYYAVNVFRENTVEFRLFASTLDPETFYASLQMVVILFRLATMVPADRLSVMTWTDLCNIGSRYPELAQVLRKLGLFRNEEGVQKYDGLVHYPDSKMPKPVFPVLMP